MYNNFYHNFLTDIPMKTKSGFQVCHPSNSIPQVSKNTPCPVCQRHRYSRARQEHQFTSTSTTQVNGCATGRYCERKIQDVRVPFKYCITPKRSRHRGKPKHRLERQGQLSKTSIEEEAELEKSHHRHESQSNRPFSIVNTS